MIYEWKVIDSSSVLELASVPQNISPESTIFRTQNLSGPKTCPDPTNFWIQNYPKLPKFFRAQICSRTNFFYRKGKASLIWLPWLPWGPKTSKSGQKWQIFLKKKTYKPCSSRRSWWWNKWHHDTNDTVTQMTPSHKWHHHTNETVTQMITWHKWHRGTNDTVTQMKPWHKWHRETNGTVTQMTPWY